MNPLLRKLAVVVGIGLLAVSIFWSQDGFNFELAGTSKYSQLAMIIGWFLALSVTVVQFVFSTSYKELNASLKLFGILAYIYSIYTNYWGIMNFQGWVEGMPKFQIGVLILAFVMDGVPEPLIAWGLYESLSGDFIGNLMRILGQTPNSTQTNQRQVSPSNNSDAMEALLRSNSRVQHPTVVEEGKNSGRPDDVPQYLKNHNSQPNGRRSQ